MDFESAKGVGGYPSLLSLRWDVRERCWDVMEADRAFSTAGGIFGIESNRGAGMEIDQPILVKMTVDDRGLR